MARRFFQIFITNHNSPSNFSHCFLHIFIADCYHRSDFNHCCHDINYIEKWPAGQRGIPSLTASCLCIPNKNTPILGMLCSVIKSVDWASFKSLCNSSRRFCYSHALAGILSVLELYLRVRPKGLLTLTSQRYSTAVDGTWREDSLHFQARPSPF
jgi:hypothetical protein